jgi:hypothetical protein
MSVYDLVPIVAQGFAACLFERRDAAGVTAAKGEI